MNQDKQKIIAGAILATCAGVTVFLFVLNTKNTISRPFAQTPQQSIAISHPSTEIDPDADGDGLTDQEETKTYGTNPTNPDTDGDGYMDGEEVAQNTNPLQKEEYPTEPSIKSLVDEKNTNYSQAMVGTLLNDLAQNDRLFYTDATSTGDIKLYGQYQPEDINGISEAITKGFLQNDEIAKLRQIEDAKLTVSPDNSRAAVEQYMEKLLSITTEKNTIEEMDTFYKELEKSILTQSDRIYVDPHVVKLAQTTVIPALSLMEKKILSLPVPSAWREMHKDQIALAAGQRLAISYLIQPSGDTLRPLYGMAMLQKIQQDSDAWKARAVEMLKSST